MISKYYKTRFVIVPVLSGRLASDWEASNCDWVTGVRLTLPQVSLVHGLMTDKLIAACKAFDASWPRARIRLFACMGPHVSLQMVASGKLAFADFTGKWFQP